MKDGTPLIWTVTALVPYEFILGKDVRDIMRRKNTEPPPIMSVRDWRRMVDDIVGKDAWFSCEPNTQRRCYEFSLGDSTCEAREA